MKAPFFSVIIPTLNEEQFLPQLLASLAIQTDKDFEVLVIDGNSTDKTVAEATSFNKSIPRLSILESSANLPFQRNLGAKKAAGMWLLFIDADSILLPYFFERIKQFIREENPTLFTTWFRPDSEITNDAIITLFTNIMLETSLIVKRPFAPGPLTIVTKDAFDLVGGYDERHSFGEDHDFSLRLFDHGVTLKVFRETLCIFSLRRFRKQGTLKSLQAYASGALTVLFTKKALKNMPGYVMGGQLYSTKKPLKTNVFKEYELKFKKLAKELFE